MPDLDSDFLNATATFYQLAETTDGDSGPPSSTDLDDQWEPVAEDVGVSYQPRPGQTGGLQSGEAGDVDVVLDAVYAPLDLIDAVRIADRVDVTHEGVTYNWRIENTAPVSMPNEGGYVWFTVADFGD